MSGAASNPKRDGPIAALPRDVASSLGADERVLFAVRPGLLFIVASSWKSLVGLLLIGALLFTVPWLQWRWGPLISAVVAMARLLWALAVWWNIRAVLTDRRVCVGSGVFRRAVQTLELERVQHLALGKLLVERIMGLGTVWVSSAAPGGAEVEWPMLNTPEAVLAMVREAAGRRRDTPPTVSKGLS
ncbi:MAG: PH domain-containing protein [Salinibacterium sp.]|nr:PH domain-containing protein [Salinibacterium sp.]